MIVLIKLFLAHFIGDFLLQPSSWVAEKQLKRAASPKLYFHVLIHGLLILLVLWEINYWLVALSLMVLHGVKDIVKLYAQKEGSKTQWFLIDQGLHIVSILGVWIFFFTPSLDFAYWDTNEIGWIYAAAILLITNVSAILMRELMASWSKALNDSNEESLNNAGKYIGILERIFVFTFVVTGNWEGIGFLLAAKSVFRFGDLKESKDRKLTEYILIGTLLSFGIAIGVGMLTLILIDFA